MARRWLSALAVGAAGVALSLAGLPTIHGWDALSEPLLLAAGLACLLTATGMGVVGYRLGREEGRGLWSSVWRGVRMMFGAALDLF